jgi:hypothetical protein
VVARSWLLGLLLLNHLGIRGLLLWCLLLCVWLGLLLGVWVGLLRQSRELGLKEVPGILCLFVNAHLIVFFYVDDLVACCLQQFNDHLVAFKHAIMAKYE